MITAAQVKELRQRTQAPMMMCKTALTECDGDVEAAIVHMRTTGLIKAATKESRIAAEGGITIKRSPGGKSYAMVEINSETDFVAKGEDFNNFSQLVCDAIFDGYGIDALSDDGIINTKRLELIAKVGENINIRRAVDMSGYAASLVSYVHGNSIGVIVELSGDHDGELAHDIAMHIAAVKPQCISEDQINAISLEKERVIFMIEAAKLNKPDAITEKIVEGKVKKYINSITLLGQPFIKDPDITIGQLLKNNNTTVEKFELMVLGDGIEKKVDNFVDDVAAQAKQ